MEQTNLAEKYGRNPFASDRPVDQRKRPTRANAKSFTIEEVAKHSSPDDCWMVIHDMVFDVTKFAEEHPGGEEVLHEIAGKDATQDYEDVGHSDDAWAMLDQYYMGELKMDEETRAKVKAAREARAKASYVPKQDGRTNPGYYFGLVVFGALSAFAYANWEYIQENYLQ